MSIEKGRPGKPSPRTKGEGCQGESGQPLETLHRSGGVGGDGMLGREARVTQETCTGEAQASTFGTNPAKGEAVAARTGVRVLHSSVETPVMGVERRRGSCTDESKAKRERGDGPQGITTPTVPETATGVRKLQRILYRQAKSKPKWKAWSLYSDVCRRDVLEAALDQVIANGGSPGVDGQIVESLKKGREGNPLRERWLMELEEDLRRKTYRPNNGITEAFHRKMKLIQRRAYGIRNFENYRLRVIAACG